ncbi:aldehyde dehydrogenase (NAD+) [Pseudonocardia thermophila]|uniref:Aldehyde dehydrogenase (NAD+) n=1 Tax=Pseudonocardia thermophila TaxID=1848 RepID=A0A1M6RX73_PSETH|nr:aldehyde dehydrogenase family protein [Pseudonocardia thermophila]SHK37041.1 aldehyde dehydrogenase (NAD+) [Pseudonocardia thermophila]
MTSSPTSAEPVPLRSRIGGAWVDGDGADLVDRNPARPDEVVAHGRLVGRAALDDAVAAAAAAAPGWAATPFPARGAILARAAAIVDEHAEAWGAELAREEGKTRAEGVGEVRRAADVLRFYAAEAQRPVGEVYASPRPGEQIHVLHKPVGTIGVITPFNFPIAIPAWKIAPALAYGNPVVWKPSLDVPLLAMRLTEALVGAGLPEGVLSLLLTDDGTAGALVEHPGIARVTFTGSTAVGRRVIAACGALARPVQAEMGGKNAAAVLADAELGLAVGEVLAGAFRSTGQKCTATSRVAVTETVADAFVAELVRRADAITVGDPLDDATWMGPLVSVAARDRVLASVAEALKRPGVRLLCGGHPFEDDRGKGAFVPPTVLELDGDDELWRSEVFGPVLAVRRAPTDRAALDLVDDSAYGLSAAVFTNRLDAVEEAAQLIDVGVLHVNSETAGADPHVPFGGGKASGFGPKEQGRAAREFFTATTTVYLRSAAAAR